MSDEARARRLAPAPPLSSSRQNFERLHWSPSTVQPGTFTLSHDHVTPPRYGLSWSLLTNGPAPGVILVMDSPSLPHRSAIRSSSPASFRAARLDDARGSLGGAHRADHHGAEGDGHLNSPE